MMPSYDFAALEARLEPVVVQGAVALLADILLARPEYLDRTFHLLCDARGLHDAIDLEPPAKAAADVVIVDRDLGGLDVEHLGRRALRHTGDLRADPEIAHAIMDVDGTVHGLHGRVREERELEGHLEDRAVLQLLERVAHALRP